MIVDADLAALCDVPTKRFNEAVKRNLARFPADFMFTLTDDEFAVLRSQSAISNVGLGGRGDRRYAPRVFTEHGALMAATILSSPRAIEISVYVVCAFARLREPAITHGDLAKRLDKPEDKADGLTTQHDQRCAERRFSVGTSLAVCAARGRSIGQHGMASRAQHGVAVRCIHVRRHHQG